MKVELEPCPFCGSDNPKMKREDAVWCGACLAEMPEHDADVPNAVARWNTRVSAQRPAGEVEQDSAGHVKGVLTRIASGEAFRRQRFAEDDDTEYFLRCQRAVQEDARFALAALSPAQRQPKQPAREGDGQRASDEAVAWAARIAALEEAAQVAEQFHADMNNPAHRVAAAIRALQEPDHAR